ncbi:MAG: MFS transporter, partial [Chloroflexota bacterium]|nr:MFS transporter [Chloroflexota bacterium]
MSLPTSSTATGEDRLFTPAFIALAAADLAYFTAAGILIQITPLFARGPLGADAVGVGVTIGAFSVTALIMRPWTGRLADRRGRRPMFTAGALLAALAIAAHALTADLAVLIGLRLVLGVAEAIFFVAGFAILADLAPPNRAGEALSFNSLALYLGLAFGPSTGELLLAIGGFTMVWIGAAALAAAAAVLALTIPETGLQRPMESRPTALIHRGVLGPSLGLFTGVAAMAGFLAFVAIYGRDDLDMGGSGPVLLVFGLVVVGCRIVFARLPDRVPPYPLAAVALAVTAAGMVVVGTLTTVAGLVAGAAIMGVGVAFVTPAFFTAIVARVQPSERGAALGTLSIFLDLAFGGGPVLLGFVADAANIPAAFLVGALVAACGAIGT